MKNKLMILFSAVSILMSANAFALIQVVSVPSTGTGVINQKIGVSVIITNTGATALTILNLIPTATYVIPTSGGALVGTESPNATNSLVSYGGPVAWAYSTFNIGPNAPNLSVPATTTVTIPYTANFFAPSTGSTGSGTGAYIAGAVVYLSDGSVNPVTQAGVVFINPLPLPVIAEPVP